METMVPLDFETWLDTMLRVSVMEKAAAERDDRLSDVSYWDGGIAALNQVKERIEKVEKQRETGGG